MRWLTFITAASAMLSLVICKPLWAQDCQPQDITLSTQAEVDSFQASHGPCNRVVGELKIEGEDIVSLSGLSDLTEIRNLKIWQNPQLPDLTDLAGLQTLSSLDIVRNPLLTNLEGLSSVGFVSTVIISSNTGLQSLVGLESLERVGYLIIRGNSSLETMQGLSGLRRIEANEFTISYNNALENLDGLESLEYVAGEMIIEDNDSLTNIDALSLLSEAATDYTFSIRIQRNPLLANLDGLVSITKITGGLIIHLNDSLADINGLSNLTEVGGWLHIAANPELTAVDGLRGLETVRALGLINNSTLANLDGLSSLRNVTWLEISWNPKLSDLSGLASLTAVGFTPSVFSGVLIEGNAILANLDGLSGLHGITGGFVVRDNPSLGDCQAVATLVDPIDDYESGPGSGGIPDISSETRIQSNMPGCNSVNQILGQVPLTKLNAGLNDAWFNFDTNGQGFLITVFPEIKQMFMAWFTYDTERPPEDITAILGEPGHRWLTAQGEYVDNIAELTLYVSTGGVFDSEEPKPRTDPYGEILLEFTTCNAGVVTYDIPSVFLMGSIPIERIALDNVSLCYVLEQQALNAKAVSE